MKLYLSLIGSEGVGSVNRSVYNNPELEEMAKEIQALLQEKMALEREVQEHEYQISAKNSETHSLQVRSGWSEAE